MALSGFVLVKLPPSGRRVVVCDFATLAGAKAARDLYASRAPGSSYSVVPAAVVRDALRGRPQ